MSKKVANANSQPVTIRLVKRASASVGFSDGIKPAGAVDDSVELSFNLDGYTVDDGRFVIGTVDTPNIKNPQSYVDNGNEFQIKNEAGKLSIVANITTNETDPNYTSRTFGLFFRLKSTDGAYVMASPRPTQAVVDYKNNITHVEKVTIKQSVGQWFNDSNYYIPLYVGTLKELFAHWNQTTALGLPELKALGHNSLYSKLNLTVDLPLESVTITNTGDFIIGKTIAITHGYVPVIAKIVKTVYSVDNPAIAEFIGTTNQLNIKSMGTVNVTVTLTDNIGNEMSTVKTFKTTLDYAPLIVKLATNNTAMTIRALGEGSTGYVDWGDNTLTPLTSENVHQYVGTAERTVKLWSSANFTLDLTTANVLTEVVQWGDSPITHALVGSTKLTKVPTTAPTGLIDASSMFKGASIFNQNLNSWDMQQVETMASMFENAGAFNGLVDTWNTGNCTDFTAMFKNAVSFNRPVNAWSMVNALNFSDMFNGATSFNQPISTWRSTVQGAAIACDRMFRGAISFNQSVTGFIDRQYVSFVEMFKGCVNFSQDMSTINFGDTIATAGMFENCTGFNGKVGSFADSELVDASNMFNGCSNFNQPIGELNTSAATNLNGMFRGCTKLNQPANDLVVTNVVSADYMFAGCPVFTSDLSDWNVESLISATGMFQGTSNFDSNLSWWCVSSLPSEPADFATGSFLARSNYPVWGTCPVRGVIIEITEKTPYLIAGTSGTMEYTANKPFTETSVVWASSNQDAVVINPLTGEYAVAGQGGATITVTVNGIYSNSRTYETIQEIAPMILDVEGIAGQPINISLANDPFRSSEAYVSWGDNTYVRLTAATPVSHQHVPGTLVKVSIISVGTSGSSLVVTGNAVKGIDAFGANNLVITSDTLTAVPAILPSDLTSLKFLNCVQLNDEKISNWNVSKLPKFVEMFKGCVTFNQPLTSWDVSEGNDFTGMFNGAAAFNQDISNWNMQNAISLEGMFENATAFNSDVGNWTVSNVSIMNRLFKGASAFNQDLAWWCVSNQLTIPSDFRTGSALVDDNLPRWGTCPNRSSVLTITDSPVSLAVEGIAQLGYTLLPTFTATSVVWSTITPELVSVDQTGLVTAIAAGVATVVLTVNNRIVASAVITIETSIDDALFAKATYIKTDDPAPMWVEAYYLPEDATGELHVDWGDGSKEVINVADYSESSYIINLKHTHTTNGEYTIKVYSTTKTVFLALGEITKLVEWGDPTNLRLSLQSANLVEVPSTLPPLMTNLSALFFKAYNFNQDISGWDTSNVTDTRNMFGQAWNFNQPIGNWNTGKVTDMAYMFSDSRRFNQDISQWCVGLIPSLPEGFNDSGILTPENTPVWGTCPSRTAVTLISNIPPTSIVGDNYNLEVSVMDNSTPIEVVTEVWSVSDSNKAIVTEVGEITLLAPGEVTVKVRVNGVYTAETTLTIEPPPPTPMTVLSTGTEVQVAAFSPIKIMVEGGETYIPSSIYIGGEPYYAQTITLPDDTPRKITIQDTFPTNPIKSIRFDKGISKVLSWNESGHVGSLANGGSKGCVHGLSSTIMEVPDFLHPSMTNLNSLFYKADAFNQDISMWDMSQVTTVDSMFAFTKAFNQDLSAWNVSNVTNMLGLFQSAVFNQDITMWDTSKVTTMKSMFSGNKIYNQPLNELNVSNVVDLTAMFQSAVFNQDLNLWDVSKVKRMTNMFYFTELFNGDISNWNTISVDDMGYMFAGAKAFNKPIGDWNTSKVTSMTMMFSGNAIFNQPLNTWNTSSVRDMSQMFNKATAFDQSIDLWDVGSVTSMNGMFKGTNYLNMYSLVTWCVKNIGSVPYEFWGNEYPNNNWPVWGTCPVRNAVTTITDIPPYLLVGQTYDLNVTIMNGEIPVTPKYAFWSVSDYNKATIDSGTGVLTTVQVGTVKVSVKLNNYYTAEVTLDILADIP